jgi:hypothetical protein
MNTSLREQEPGKVNAGRLFPVLINGSAVSTVKKDAADFSAGYIGEDEQDLVLLKVQPLEKKVKLVPNSDLYQDKCDEIINNAQFIEDLAKLGLANAEDISHFTRLIMLDTLELAACA